MKNTPITIGLDLGNAFIKTANTIFPADLIRHGSCDPGIDGQLMLDGQYYSIGITHDSIERDKTKSDRYYILSIFAIIQECLIRDPEETDFNVVLALGVMPSSLNRQYNLDLKDYFTQKNPIQIRYDQTFYRITFEDFYIFPTGLSALAVSKSSIRSKERSLIIDIGAGKTEYLVYRNRQIDRGKCFSVNEGTISIASEVIMQVSVQYGFDIDESDIHMVLTGEDTLLPQEVISLINELYKKKALAIINHTRDYGLDPRNWYIYLMGGGANYFRAWFTRQNGVNWMCVEDNVQANAQGAELLAFAQQQKREQRVEENSAKNFKGE